MTGRIGHDISPEVAAAVAEVDRCAGEMKAALAALTRVWESAGIPTLKERRVMRAAANRALRSAT
jgi:hypothetical protein